MKNKLIETIIEEGLSVKFIIEKSIIGIVSIFRIWNI